MVALGGVAQPVEGVGRHLDGGPEAEGVVGGGEVVVDRLGHRHDVDAHLPQLGGDPQRAVAADHDQRVDPGGAHVLDHLGGAVGGAAAGQRVGEGVGAVGGAEDRAAEADQVADVGGAEPAEAPLDEPREAVQHPHDLGAVDPLGGADDGADHGVEAGGVAAAGEDPEALGGHGTAILSRVAGALDLRIAS